MYTFPVGIAALNCNKLSSLDFTETLTWGFGPGGNPMYNISCIYGMTNFPPMRITLGNVRVATAPFPLWIVREEL